MSFQLRRGGVIGGVSVGALALVTVGAGLAGAQVTNPIGVSPGTGAPGTDITVSGDDCDGTAVSLLLAGDGTVDTDQATVGSESSWSGTLTADEELVEPGQTLTITATCLGGTMIYQPASFLVAGVPPTTSSTTTSTTTTSTTSTTAPPSPTTTAPGPGGPDPTSPPTTTAPTPPTTAAPVPTPAPADPVDDEPDFAG